MRLIPRYIIRQMSVMAVYALLVFLALYNFSEVISEMDDVGKGSYISAKMVQYVLMQMPARAHELMSLGVLIGGLVTLSQLASGNELTVIKASGMSMRRLLAVLSQFGLVFALAIAVLGEWAAPGLNRRVESMKASAINGGISASTLGLWMKEQNNIINVRGMPFNHVLLGVKIWQHDDRYQLASAAGAESAALNSDGG